MKTTIEHSTGTFTIDLNKPIDISIPLRAGKENVNAFYAEPVRIEPFRMEGFVGSVKEGAPVNYMNIFFNPHGNGTHTECVGHISKEDFSINQSLKNFFFLSQLISVTPEIKPNGDRVISKAQLQNANLKTGPEAIVIRTLPNENDKLNFQYTGTNPAYLDEAATEFLVEKEYTHLLIDTPSVDREEDEGKLLSHHAWWNYPTKIRAHSTITEMIFIPNDVKDGLYFLNLQIASFENDASPSKPLLYALQ
ncbi:MAG: cyclase family protein [Bacteroidia bacterium]|nr:cyclase family protein [Bacteroidia bacterium]